MPNSNKKVDPAVVVAAMICITLLAIAAMFMGMNHDFYLIVVGIIAYLAGWVSPTPKFIEKIMPKSE